MIWTFCILYLCYIAQARNIRFGSFGGVEYIFNHTKGEGWCNPSFECDIISYLCWRLGDGADCTLTIFHTLEERITALENDKVDIVVSRFSTLAERALRVDFVRPYYYSTGAQLFSLPGDRQLFSSFEDLLSQLVCMDLGYYAAQTLVEEYGFFMLPSTKESVRELIEQGYCIAAITDSVFDLDGLVRTDTPVLYEQPYAIAISKSPTIKNLKMRIQDVLLEMMIKQDEKLSVLEQLEEKYLFPQNIQKNEKLSQLSDTITVNGGKYVSVQVEDDIWNAQSVASTKRLQDELLVIDPEYDQLCKQGLNNIFKSYKNGTSIDDLPYIQVDSVAYTFILQIEDPNNFIQTQVNLVHPFFQKGTTVQQINERNPQFATATTQATQDKYLSDPKFQKEGAEFYKLSPFDAAQVLDGNRTWNSFFSPTRVVKTTLFKIIQEYVSNEKPLILAGCGVGERRNW
eukprot:TRINITY_DN15378_c0_g2_i4.p1 TRINITY_DN15378_c0_g2~~TRINITY_DN15378_c0_g2_i4.p1  ORF type:complete len:457 (-),score=34.87 TRINITY_DN15378_c0_g2_i4:643-2013(-)